MRLALPLRFATLLLALAVAGCQEPQGPPAKPPAPPPDVPKEVEQPAGGMMPRPSQAQQQPQCKGLCGTLDGPAVFTVAFCTAANACAVNSAWTQLCQAQGNFKAECTRRDQCPANTACKPLGTGMGGGQGFVNPVPIVNNAPGCPAGTPNLCQFQIALFPPAAAGQPPGQINCSCDCL